MARTITLISPTLHMRDRAQARGRVAALADGARAIGRALRALFEPYLPGSRARLRGWETSLGMWSPLAEAPRPRTRQRGRRGDV